MKKMMLYVVAGAVALAVVVGVSVFTVFLFKDKLGGSAAESGAPAAVDLAKGRTVPLKPFVTNLADTERPRYVNVTFELVLYDEKAVEAIQPYLPGIRDAVVGVLNTKKSMEVTGAEGANKLKGDVLEKVNSIIPGKPVKQVLITDIVVQF